MTASSPNPLPPQAVEVVVAETGGSATRAALLVLNSGSVTLEAAGLSSGANPNTVGVPAAASAWRQAFAPLLNQSRSQTYRGVLSCGGSDSVATVAYSECFGSVPFTVTDLQAPVWAVSPTGTGTVLVAGTGAMAVVLEQGQILRQAGGWGWWLGDEGSGTWLGREVARLALEDLDAARITDLTARVADRLGLDCLTRQALFSYVYTDLTQVAATTGSLAPLVDELSHDVRIVDLVDRAAVHLVGLLDRVRPVLPLTLVGSVAASAVGREAVSRLDGSPSVQKSGLVGAAMLAFTLSGVPWSEVLRDQVATALSPL